MASEPNLRLLKAGLETAIVNENQENIKGTLLKLAELSGMTPVLLKVGDAWPC